MELNGCSGTEFYWLQWDRKAVCNYSGAESVNGLVKEGQIGKINWLHWERERVIFV